MLARVLVERHNYAIPKRANRIWSPTPVPIAIIARPYSSTQYCQRPLCAEGRHKSETRHTNRLACVRWYGEIEQGIELRIVFRWRRGQAQMLK